MKSASIQSDENLLQPQQLTELAQAFNNCTRNNQPFVIPTEWDVQTSYEQKIPQLIELLSYISLSLKNGEYSNTLSVFIDNLLNIGHYLYNTNTIDNSCFYVKLVADYLAIISDCNFPNTIYIHITILIQTSPDIHRNNVWTMLLIIVNPKDTVVYSNLMLAMDSLPSNISIILHIYLLSFSLNRLNYSPEPQNLLSTIDAILKICTKLEYIFKQNITANLSSELALCQLLYMKNLDTTLVQGRALLTDLIHKLVIIDPTLKNKLIYTLQINASTKHLSITLLWCILSITVINLNHTEKDISQIAILYDMLNISLSNYPPIAEFIYSPAVPNLAKTLLELKTTVLLEAKNLKFPMSHQLSHIMGISSILNSLTEESIIEIKIKLWDLTHIYLVTNRAQIETATLNLINSEQITKLPLPKCILLHAIIWDVLKKFPEESCVQIANKTKTLIINYLSCATKNPVTQNQIIFCVNIISNRIFLKYFQPKEQPILLKLIHHILQTHISSDPTIDDAIVQIMLSLSVENSHTFASILQEMTNILTISHIYHKSSPTCQIIALSCMQKLLELNNIATLKSKPYQENLALGYDILTQNTSPSATIVDICSQILTLMSFVKIEKELQFLGVTTDLNVNPSYIILQYNRIPPHIQLRNQAFFDLNPTIVKQLIQKAMQGFSFIDASVTNATTFHLTIKHAPSLTLDKIKNISIKATLLSLMQPSQLHLKPEPKQQSIDVNTPIEASLKDNKKPLLDLLVTMQNEITFIITHQTTLNSEFEKGTLAKIQKALNSAHAATVKNHPSTCNKQLLNCIQHLRILFNSPKKERVIETENLPTRVNTLLERLEMQTCYPENTGAAHKPTKQSIKTVKKPHNSPQPDLEKKSTRVSFFSFVPNTEKKHKKLPLFCGLKPIPVEFPITNSGYIFGNEFQTFISKSSHEFRKHVFLLTGGTAREGLQNHSNVNQSSSDLDYLTTFPRKLIKQWLLEFWQSKEWPPPILYSRKILTTPPLKCLTILATHKDGLNIDIDCTTIENLPQFVAKTRKGLNYDQYFVTCKNTPHVYSPYSLEDFRKMQSGMVEFIGGNFVDIVTENPEAVLRFYRFNTNARKEINSEFLPSQLAIVISAKISPYKFISELKRAHNPGAMLMTMIKTGILPIELREEFLSYYDISPLLQEFCYHILSNTDNKAKIPHPNIWYLLALLLLPKVLQQENLNMQEAMSKVCIAENEFCRTAFSAKAVNYLTTLHNSYNSFLRFQQPTPTPLPESSETKNACAY